MSLGVFDTMPRLDGSYFHFFAQAYELDRAVYETMRLANKLHDKLTSEQLAQRKQLLEIPLQILLNERNKLLDSFCIAWLKHRGIK